MLSFNINIFIYFLLVYLLGHSAFNVFVSIEVLHNGVTNTGIFSGLIQLDTMCLVVLSFQYTGNTVFIYFHILHSNL